MLTMVWHHLKPVRWGGGRDRTAIRPPPLTGHNFVAHTQVTDRMSQATVVGPSVKQHTTTDFQGERKEPSPSSQ